MAFNIYDYEKRISFSERFIGFFSSWRNIVRIVIFLFIVLLVAMLFFSPVRQIHFVPRGL